MAHELIEGFADLGLPLAKPLTDMLDEQAEHRTERRGCGLTQATRLIADQVNQSGDVTDPTDLSLFRDWSLQAVRQLADALVAMGWPHGWRRLDDFPQAWSYPAIAPDCAKALAALRPRLRELRPQLTRLESQLILDLVDGVLARDGGGDHDLTGMRDKPEIGSCSQAEEFFLELSHARLRRGAVVNLFVAPDDTPLLLEKVNLGESHSAMALAPITVNGVRIPAGGLCGLRYDPEIEDRNSRATHYGHIMPLARLRETRFFRLSTLSVPPQIRHRAFNRQLEVQLQRHMLSPEQTTLDELRQFAEQVRTSTP
jgi:hypothetical protein